MLRSSHDRLLLPAVALACLGMLQPGIDPVFLTLLSSAHGLAPELHGWVVSASQTGMAAGSLITWRWGVRFHAFSFMLAALIAAFAALATAQSDYLPLLLGIRCLYGMAMGVLYTQAMSEAAINRPHGAYGAVFLCQLLLSTGVALTLPAIADAASPRVALATLAAVPLAALAITSLPGLSRNRAPFPALQIPPASRDQPDPRAWAAAAATLLFICATMMVWTFSGALAVEAGISEDVIGRAVALGSLAGAGTALLVMRERPVIPPPITGLLGGLSLICPVIATRNGDAELFVASIVLLNIGSTAIIVRGSGLASSACAGGLFRRFVACTHALGMILGPLTGAVVTLLFGRAGLFGAAIFAIAAACLLLLYAQGGTPKFRLRGTSQESLDEYMTNVQH